jgi:hypothetical protein
MVAPGDCIPEISMLVVSNPVTWDCLRASAISDPKPFIIGQAIPWKKYSSLHHEEVLFSIFFTSWLAFSLA